MYFVGGAAHLARLAFFSSWDPSISPWQIDEGSSLHLSNLSLDARRSRSKVGQLILIPFSSAFALLDITKHVFISIQHEPILLSPSLIPLFSVIRIKLRVPCALRVPSRGICWPNVMHLLILPVSLREQHCSVERRYQSPDIEQVERCGLYGQFVPRLASGVCMPLHSPPNPRSLPWNKRRHCHPTSTERNFHVRRAISWTSRYGRHHRC